MDFYIHPTQDELARPRKMQYEGVVYVGFPEGGALAGVNSGSQFLSVSGSPASRTVTTPLGIL